MYGRLNSCTTLPGVSHFPGGTAPPLWGREVAATPYAQPATTASPTVQTPLPRLQPTSRRNNG